MMIVIVQMAHQYGVPIKDFLLAAVALISAATPKSAARAVIEGRWKQKDRWFKEEAYRNVPSRQLELNAKVYVTVTWSQNKFLLTQFDISSLSKKYVGTLHKKSYLFQQNIQYMIFHQLSQLRGQNDNEFYIV